MVWLWNNFYFLHTLARGFVSLSGQVYGCILLPGQYAQLQFRTILRQSPQSIEEGTAVLEMVCNELAISIEARTVALIVYA